MAKKKKAFGYFVWIGTSTGFCETWMECSQKVIGYPSSEYVALRDAFELALMQSIWRPDSLSDFMQIMNDAALRREYRQQLIEHNLLKSFN